MDRAFRAQLQRDLARLADGDRDAFHPVFVQVWPVLRAFLRRHLPAEEAEDAAQEALLSVFRRAAEFDPGRDALAWLFGIAAYQVKTARRKRQRRRETAWDEGTDVREAGGGPDEALLAREQEESVRAALAALPPLDAATLVAFADGDRPAVAPATFRKRVQRALLRLRAAWRASHGHE